MWCRVSLERAEVECRIFVASHFQRVHVPHVRNFQLSLFASRCAALEVPVRTYPFANLIV